MVRIRDYIYLILLILGVGVITRVANNVLRQASTDELGILLVLAVIIILLVLLPYLGWRYLFPMLKELFSYMQKDETRRTKKMRYLAIVLNVLGAFGAMFIGVIVILESRNFAEPLLICVMALLFFVLNAACHVFDLAVVDLKLEKRRLTLQLEIKQLEDELASRSHVPE